MEFISKIIAHLGLGAANVGTQGCMILITDEPKMPKALLEK